MASSKLKQAFGAVKDRTTISLAKVGSTSTLSDLDVAIVKATRHEEFPAEDKYIKEILSLTCYSRLHITSCVNTLAKRLNKTRNWVVALKSLMLIHRLLVEGDPAYEEEIFFSPRRGSRFLNMSDFCDNSRSDSWDYSAFVRTFARYIDEWLEYRMEIRRARRRVSKVHDGAEGAEQPRPGFKVVTFQEMDNDEVFSRMQFLQQLLDRFLACRPTGGAKKNRIIFVALYLVVKESFHIYQQIAEVMIVLLQRFAAMEVTDCVKVYEIFLRLRKQFDELDVFYGWSKILGITRSSEHPEVEKITQKQLDAMDEFINEKSAKARDKRGRTDSPETKGDHNCKALIEDLGPKKEEKISANTQQEVDLLNLDDIDDLVKTVDHVNKSSNDDALLTGVIMISSPTVQEALSEGTYDWETALVQSTSTVPNQTAKTGEGFDMWFLDSMYEQAAAAMAGNSCFQGSSGSAAFGSNGQQALLALPPIPPPEGDSLVPIEDPFAASGMVMPPPPPVANNLQMSEMEKQKLLMEEQIMWPQYAAANVMQGQFGMSNSYHMGGVYTRN